jgi:hypothetical protein
VRARAAAAAAAAGVLALAGCGAASPDLFEVKRSGEGRNARLDMVVNDGGSVTCNGSRHALNGDLLLRARELARDLAKPAQLNLALPPGPGAVLRYRVRLEQGSVAFSDTSRHQPHAFLVLQALTKDVAEDVCRLPR